MRGLMATIILTAFGSAFLKAQFHVPVLPGLEGEALEQALIEQYRPPFVLSYSDARDTLYANIDARNDTLYCVYTAYGVYLPPDEDPTTAAFQNGQGLNTEHTYPRGKGTEPAQPKADMHHIFPARVSVNADRGSLPFDDIPPAEASQWYYLDMEQSNAPPASVIGLYSRVKVNEAFEPRDSHKGDVARAMFYVYTVYRQEVDAADPDYFAPQIPTLCQWNTEDPVDDREWQRTYAIAAHQGGIANPFIQDCTLATRTYCAGITPPCIPSGLRTHNGQNALAWQLFPNPASDQLTITIDLPVAMHLSVEMHSAPGQSMASISLGHYPAGQHQIPVGLKKYGLAEGMYFCQIQAAHAEGSVIRTKPLVVTR
jgi:endonuclease I